MSIVGEKYFPRRANSEPDSKRCCYPVHYDDLIYSAEVELSSIKVIL